MYLYIYIHTYVSIRTNMYILFSKAKKRLQDFPPIQSVGRRTLSSKKTCLISSSGNTSGSSTRLRPGALVKFQNMKRTGKNRENDEKRNFQVVNNGCTITN